MSATWGAIFDWDGVVVDSSRHHEESWERLAVETGHPLPEGHFKRGFGMKNEIIIPNQLGWTKDPDEISRFSLRKEALYRIVTNEWGLELLPGVADLLDYLDNAGVPRCIGSSTHLLNLTTGLERLGIVDRFPMIVSAEDVSHGKPDPEVFLTAAAKIGLPPERCVVFEDALVGIEAAKRGGMRVVAVATTNPAEALHEADLVVHRLSDLDFSVLEGWFR